MNAQIPRKYREEEKRLLCLYMDLPDGTHFGKFVKENASRDYLRFMSKRRRRAQRLWNKYGIIEN